MLADESLQTGNETGGNAAIINLTATYAWVVPSGDLTKKLPELGKFSSLAIPHDVDQIERFSTLLFNTNTKQRVLFEGSPELGADNEFRLSLSIHTNQIEKISLASVLDAHYLATDLAYQKTNAWIESLFR